jgi:arylsulfatase A-like enzyme
MVKIAHRCDAVWFVYWRSFHQTALSAGGAHRHEQRAAFANNISATRQPNHIRCIRTREWKYAYYFDPKELSSPSLAQPREYEMYNLADDPHQVHNLGNPTVKGYDLRRNVKMRKALAAQLDKLVAARLAP